MAQENVKRSLDERQVEVADKITSGMEARRRGGPNLKAQHLVLIDGFVGELPPEAIAEWKAGTAADWDRVNAKVAEVPNLHRRKFWLEPDKPEPKGEVAKGPSETGAALKVSEKAKAEPEVRFHRSDLKPEAKLPTIEEKQRALEELADLRDTDPLAYAEGRKEWAKRLFTTVVAIDQAVKIVLDRRKDDGDQSQATKLIAIGMGDKVRRWHSPSGEGFASVRVGEHWQNYRIHGTLFKRWLLDQYAHQNTVKVGDKLVPQVPGSGAIRDAIDQLDGIACFRGEEQHPAFRVGGTRDEIWIDLGDENWRSVRVTADGWRVKDKPEVAFVRTGPMLPLPEPVGGGSIQALRQVLNVRASDFVLVVGWLLGALYPVGPYAELNPCGPSEAGKTITSKLLLRTIDPNLTQLRRPSRKIEDLLIAARNGWTVGLDNVSWLTAEVSDVLCMISTGISSGTRAHYTNDEEHVYTVQRPVLFNGIPSELIERSDLASRTIKLQIPPISVRRTEAELEEEFVRVWPGVFGALLDGLVVALRDHHSIQVAKPARLMDFERLAEAGCRAMGFGEWEFVKAYAANRKHSLIISLEGSAVGRAVLAFMNTKIGKAKGFEGQMSVLLQKLSVYDGGSRDWPKDATRLSTALYRILQPLAAVGIDCVLREDRRGEGGSQKDVVLTWCK
jgi:hypothetical protein